MGEPVATAQVLVKPDVTPVIEFVTALHEMATEIMQACDKLRTFAAAWDECPHSEGLCGCDTDPFSSRSPSI